VPEADAVKAEFKDEIEFFHPGTNWSGVKCSACGADAETWWTEAMNDAHATGFSDLMLKATCCGAYVSLNDLQYVWPAAFGSFVLEAMNPDVEQLTPSEEEQLESCLGCELRRIWAHI
jgi:hypothetical protein